MSINEQMVIANVDSSMKSKEDVEEALTKEVEDVIHKHFFFKTRMKYRFRIMRSGKTHPFKVIWHFEVELCHD